MGGQSSQPPPPPPLLNKPWREIHWGRKEESLHYVDNYKPFDKDQQIRILLHGQSGAGKSSFINSVQSALRGRMCRQALAANTSGDSFTKKFYPGEVTGGEVTVAESSQLLTILSSLFLYQAHCLQYKTYKIQRDSPDVFYPFVFNDIMGLSKHKGVFVDDIKLILHGRVKDSYKFNPESKLSESDEHFNKAPTDNEKVHVLVCMVAADTLSSMSDEVLRQVKEIREEASHLDIPQIAILTKVDAACPEVKEDLQDVYRSRYLKEMMERFSVNTGIPMDSIFLVKNYHEEIDLNDDVDSLILSVLTHIINAGEDFANKKLETM